MNTAKRITFTALVSIAVAGPATLLAGSGHAQEAGPPQRPSVETEVLPGQACLNEQRLWKKTKKEKSDDKIKDQAKKRSAGEKAEERRLVTKYGVDPNCEENSAKPRKSKGARAPRRGSEPGKKAEAPGSFGDGSQKTAAADRGGWFDLSVSAAGSTAGSPNVGLTLFETLDAMWVSMARGVRQFGASVGSGEFLVSPAVAQASPPSVLVLYDHRPADQYGKLGSIYAIMLRNLLGHFDAAVDLLPVQDYAAGRMETYDAVFYIGAYYDNPVPEAFLVDVAQTDKTVVWFRDNIWQLAWNPVYDFTAKFGLAFDGLAGMNAAPTPEDPSPGFFDTVRYKGKSLPKYYNYNGVSNVVFADPTIGLVRVADPAKASVEVDVVNSGTNQAAPYIARSGNFWYIADVPFSYIGPRDRYLVVADILHDILGVAHNDAPAALVRLEDVGALTGQQEMKTLTDYMLGKNIPFSIALIPLYRDPGGIFNGGTPQEIHLADDEASELREAVNYASLRGGHVVMHGYTHQYESMPNPYRAISGEDFEFWNIVDNRPVASDSASWVLGRLDAGLAELSGSGFTPFAWETPHYHASPVANRTFPQRFDTTYNRTVYYTSDTPDLDVGNPTKDFSAGQFFPYIIEEDYYGQRILPENLGNIEYDISDIDPTSDVVYTWQDLLENARYAQVVRDGYASFFFHPFWLERDLGTPGFRDFQSLVDGITGLGYQWADPSTL